MQSSLYEGHITHQRYRPVKHRFTYPIYLGYVDLDELPQLVGRGGPLSTRRFDATSIFVGDVAWQAEGDLSGQVRRYLANEAGVTLDGPVRLLSPFRHFGYYFSPLNLYYCFAADGQSLRSVVAEVNNTPWGERHWYVIDGGLATRQQAILADHQKQFHVSPFMPMGLQYRWQLNVPDESLDVGIECREDAAPLFRAKLSLTRKRLDRANVRRLSLRYPLATGRTVTAIYYQALRLWLKRCPFYPHPRKTHAPTTRPSGTIAR